MPIVLTDDELRQIRVPTLLVIGQQEPLYDPNAAVERATRLMPNLRTELIPDAGHLLPMEQPELANKCILEYLEQ
jgi:pimeloyl-ACP methyl ester carboxylesterase